MIKQALYVFLAAILLAVIAGTAFELEGGSRQPQGTITILRGQNALQIAADLKSEGYIKNKLRFLFYLARDGQWRNLKSGEYNLIGLDDRQIIEKMVSGRTAPKIATIIPGWTVADIQKSAGIVKILSDADFGAVDVEALKGKFDFLREIPDGGDLEGYLFPDTYQLPENAAINDLITPALENFSAKLDLLGREKIAAKNLSVRGAVIMASILEKEVRTLEDKKIAAGILWKRLNSGMPLQTDATLLYYKAGSPDRINKDSDSPYNTYKYTGLPPGPICNPGFDSLEAAIEPIETDYWYYLSSSDGTTIFSKTYDEHLQNIARYLE
ncbi:MAG: endolytic transglycosylase MltG [Minisyncoccales bacterium]